METETNTRAPAAPVVNPRPSCNAHTYSDWLRFNSLHPMHYTSALGRMVDLGGTWTVGPDLFPYPNSIGLCPRQVLAEAVRRGHAVQVDVDTWAITDRGRAVDAGRPHPVPVWTNHPVPFTGDPDTDPDLIGQPFPDALEARQDWWLAMAEHHAKAAETEPDLFKRTHHKRLSERHVIYSHKYAPGGQR